MSYSPATHAIAVIVGDGHATTTTPALMETIPANATSPRSVSELSVIPDITSNPLRAGAIRPDLRASCDRCQAGCTPLHDD